MSMTLAQLESVIDSDEWSDKDRVWCAASRVMEGNKVDPVDVHAVAARLGWTASRTQTALYAAVDAGLLGTPQTRAEHDLPRVDVREYTIARAEMPA